jgi:hypothetical protein
VISGLIAARPPVVGSEPIMDLPATATATFVN